MDNSLVIEDDLDPGDAYEYHHKQKDDLVTFCQGSARYQAPYEPGQRPFAPRQRNNSRDYDPKQVYPPVLTGIPCAAISVKNK